MKEKITIAIFGDVFPYETLLQHGRRAGRYIGVFFYLFINDIDDGGGNDGKTLNRTLGFSYTGYGVAEGSRTVVSAEDVCLCNW